MSGIYLCPQDTDSRRTNRKGWGFTRELLHAILGGTFVVLELQMKHLARAVSVTIHNTTQARPNNNDDEERVREKIADRIPQRRFAMDMPYIYICAFLQIVEFQFYSFLARTGNLVTTECIFSA